MKLLYFVSDYSIGLSALLCDQLVSINKTSLDVIGIAGDKEQEQGLSQYLSENNVNVIRVDGLDEHRNFKSLAKKICEIAQRENVNVIHVQNNWQLALVSYARFICGLSNVKVVYTLHAFRNNHRVKSIIARVVMCVSLFLFAHKVICMSRYLATKFLLLKYKIELIPLGVSDAFFLERVQIDYKNGLQMIFPAQFRQGKNQELLIRAFAEYLYLSKDAKSKLTLPGAGMNLEKCKALSVQLGIENRVIFPGALSKEEVFRLYLVHNIGLISSNCETFGQSIVEPFVLGRCVISTKVGVAPEIIVNDKSGFLFKNEKELVEILLKLNNNIELLDTISDNNFEARGQFRWSVVSDSYVKLISCFAKENRFS